MSDPGVRGTVKGRVMYEDSTVLDGLKWAAVSAAGIHDGVPCTAAMVAKHPCLAALPVLFTVPPAASFGDDLDVYAWAIDTLLDRASTKASSMLRASV